MVHQVGAHGLVQFHLKGDLQFGAYAIYARNQHGIAIFLFINGEEPAEAANLAQHSLGEGLVRQILDALLGAVGLRDVHTGIGVGNSGALWWI